ncbi:MAG: class I SAM-dependent methyltransferase [Paracoccaceae bacterium]|jgi:SAM-dependent methyltransferase|nr:class I SAM-dependent methyltransferase [Paracoccaceae bacterium]
MDKVQQQYEAYPYPARDPVDEAKRLVVGSPSNPVEVDHMIFGGKRNWKKPFRALFAGGGTGDALIMMAQKLSTAKCPAEITYLDMSTASRKVAEARAKARGLTNITFITGDLMTAPDHGEFDYIDSTGVLHHLPDPQAGFNALAKAIAPGGGFGCMVYAPYGRTGVYPLQEALNTLTAGEAPEVQVAAAKDVLKGLPSSNWFPKNEFVGDHKVSDAGLYDLLLHSSDRPYTVEEIAETLDVAGLSLVSFHEPGRYDPRRYLPVPLWPRLESLDAITRAGLAERLAGDMKTHCFYAVRKDQARSKTKFTQTARPRLSDLPAAALGRQIEKRGEVKIESNGQKVTIEVPKRAGALIALADGGLQLGQIAQMRGLDWIAFSSLWAPVDEALTGFNLLHYSEGMS